MMVRSRFKNQWYFAEGATEIPSPALLVYPDRIAENIQRMIKIAGGTGHIWPHVKTHKMSGIIRLKQKCGITRFKCATLAEAEMVARCGGEEIMLAMQPVGPQIDKFLKLQVTYPMSRFSALVDHASILGQIAAKAAAKQQAVDVWLDINNGMNRTGIVPDDSALQLYAKISNTPFLTVRGLHVYDGHIHEHDPDDRKKACERDFKPVTGLIHSIRRSGLDVPLIMAGGTPTFTIHASRGDTETSPGTCVLWDSGYQENFPDLPFLPAATLMTRIISKPGKNLLCLDLGHKSVASEMPHPRVSLQNIKVSRFVNHSEEHLVIESPEAGKWEPGDMVFGIPWHICPTVPRFRSAYTVIDGKIEGEWQVDARDRLPAS